MKIIAYEENGFVCIITPSSECGLSVDEIAIKDVPNFLPYVILDDSELPDRELRELWRIVDSKVVVAE